MSLMNERLIRVFLEHNNVPALLKNGGGEALKRRPNGHGGPARVSLDAISFFLLRWFGPGRAVYDVRRCPG
jgi:hypothetical protein